jgi:phosphatidylglycerol:prolipoprotein diacylglycerol transferase
VFGLYLVLAGTERLLVEIIRRNDSVVAGLTLAQLVSLAMMALGAAVLWSRRKVPRPATA